jgi:hypothetical protein
MPLVLPAVLIRVNITLSAFLKRGGFGFLQTFVNFQTLKVINGINTDLSELAAFQGIIPCLI